MSKTYCIVSKDETGWITVIDEETGLPSGEIRAPGWNIGDRLKPPENGGCFMVKIDE